MAERRLAKWYEGGAEKYTDRNWEKGINTSRFLDSLKRHTNAYETIKLFEREGLPLTDLPADINPHEDHLAAIIWNAMGIIRMEGLKPEYDDLGRRDDPPAEEPTTPPADDSLSRLRELLNFFRTEE